MSDSVDSRLARLAVERLGLDEVEVDPSRTFAELDLDSLALVELVVGVEEEFGLPIEEDEVTSDMTLAGVAELIRRRSTPAGR